MSIIIMDFLKIMFKLNEIKREITSIAFICLQLIQSAKSKISQSNGRTSLYCSSANCWPHLLDHRMCNESSGWDNRISFFVMCALLIPPNAAKTFSSRSQSKHCGIIRRISPALKWKSPAIYHLKPKWNRQLSN